MIEKKQDLKFFREIDSIKVEKRDQRKKERSREMRQSGVMISRENDKIAKTKIRAKSLPKVYFFLHMETKLTLSTTIFPEIARNQCL